MRVVFPCAHHNRFVHSIGTYHVGRMAIDAILEEFPLEAEYSDLDKKTLHETFTIACLLHDCGHSPFSHLLEHYFISEDEGDDLDEKILGHSCNQESMRKDFLNLKAKPHEKVSSYLALTYYKGAINKINPNIDLDVVVRMILGCKFSDQKKKNHKIYNCLIPLLNGPFIDVDKLDYFARDRWATGYFSSTIDLERLVSAFRIRFSNGNYQFCIKKSALHEIESVLDSTKFQRIWVFQHHKIVYDEMLLEKSLEALFRAVDDTAPRDIFRRSLFDLRNLTNYREVYGNPIYQLTDDDILSLLKKYVHDNKYFLEWISRDHRLVPLWKTNAEYVAIMRSFVRKLKYEKIGSILIEIIEALLRENGIDENSYYLYAAVPKIKTISKKNDLLIDVDGKIMGYKELVPSENHSNVALEQYYLIFVPREIVNNSTARQKLQDFIYTRMKQAISVS